MKKPALLILEDGTTFHGISIGADGMSAGEIIFNTSITGYQEILTDPSYARQLVTLTYPHIGNVGTNHEDIESDQVFCAGLIVRNVPKRYSNWRATGSLSTFLEERNIMAISDIDTRKLTRLIRARGAQKGCIAAGNNIDQRKALKMALDFPGLAGMDIAREVSVSAPYSWKSGSWSLDHGYRQSQSSAFKVIAYDYGIKHNILRLLVDHGCEVIVVPAQTSASEVLGHHPDGVFLSNGPGDPEPCDYAVQAIREIMDRNIPIFGICLGHQLLSLASGASTSKMKFGHHGANHPVQDIETKQVLITSQNHGFTVNEESLGSHIRITHRSLFDNTVQGIERLDKSAFSFQGHPEASPGPKDMSGLFDKFINMMNRNRMQKGTADA